jgi:RHS repeat-associated protein
VLKIGPSYKLELVGVKSGYAKEYTYIYAPTGLAAVHIKQSADTKASIDSEEILYAHTDYLGSIMTLSNENGEVEENYFYDAWGKRKDPEAWDSDDASGDWILDRGYTGHEHLFRASLINMNGRMYDPVLGRMLSPDPVLQAPYNTQNHNRYSYVMNNPLKYTDPSGYRMVYKDFLADENRAHGGGGSWYAGDDFFGNWGNSNYQFYSTIPHIANNRFGADGGWTYNSTTGDYDNVFTGETRDKGVQENYVEWESQPIEATVSAGKAIPDPPAEGNEENNSEDPNSGSNNASSDEENKPEEKDLKYGTENVFAEDNGGDNWSGGGCYVRFGTTPYASTLRSSNTKYTESGEKMMCDSWAFTVGGFGAFGTIPQFFNVVLWMYSGGRIVQETNGNGKEEK